MTLWDLKTDGKGEVLKFETLDSDLKLVFNDLGLASKTSVKCLLRGFLGSPSLYEINGSVCSLCEDAAKKVVLSPLSV